MRGTSWSAVALAAAVVLGGCSGGAEDGGGAAGPEPGPRSSSTAPQDVAAPALPDEARVQSEAGAAAFVEHYVDLFNHMQATGATEEIAAVSDAACETCTAAIELADETWGGGGRTEGGRLVLEPFRLLPADYGADYGFIAMGTSEEQRLVEGNGSVREFTGGPLQVLAYPDWVDGAWLMRWLRMPPG